MSPFAHLLRKIRTGRDVRQAELAKLIGYEQSYISALEVGLKGPPPPEFVERLGTTLKLTPSERDELRQAAEASHRKLVIEPDMPQEAFWLLSRLRAQFSSLSPSQIRIIDEVLRMGAAPAHDGSPVARRTRRRTREEAQM